MFVLSVEHDIGIDVVQSLDVLGYHGGDLIPGLLGVFTLLKNMNKRLTSILFHPCGVKGFLLQVLVLLYPAGLREVLL